MVFHFPTDAVLEANLSDGPFVIVITFISSQYKRQDHDMIEFLGKTNQFIALSRISLVALEKMYTTLKLLCFFLYIDDKIKKPTARVIEGKPICFGVRMCPGISPLVGGAAALRWSLYHHNDCP